MTQAINRIGLRNGKLLIIGPSKTIREKNGRSIVHWLCRCDCGTIKWIKGDNLQQGKTSSCGCYRAECLKKGRLKTAEKRKTGWAPCTTHGMSGSKVHNTWMRIKARCLCPSDVSFPHYGARGITLHEPWQKDFEAFYAHIGNPPSPTHSIERINNDGNYEPGNVRWATRQEQCNNRRNTCRYDGMTIVELSHKYQIHFERLKYLLQQRKLPLNEALNQCGINYVGV